MVIASWLCLNCSSQRNALASDFQDGSQIIPVAQPISRTKVFPLFMKLTAVMKVRKCQRWSESAVGSYPQ